VVNGLGHGLDESGVRAAQQINLPLAKRDGRSVDFPAGCSWQVVFASNGTFTATRLKIEPLVP